MDRKRVTGRDRVTRRMIDINIFLTMYFLAKFCRICVQTGVKLLDLDTLDFDKVKLSEKLEACTKMVVTRESLSTEICMHCLSKLRVSYEFNDMCKKSSKKIHGYFRAIISKSNEKICPENFLNTELNIVVTPLRGFESEAHQPESHSQREKRKRITKEQRCSLLKKLLTNKEKQTKERDKQWYEYYYRPLPTDHYKGGLKNIINFTKNYEFGIKLDKNSNYESTPLDKLKTFSTEYFRRDFSDFKNTILYIIENKDSIYDSGDSDDELFEEVKGHDDSKEDIVMFEEVIVEPDVRIKSEVEFEEDDEDENYDYYCEYPDKPDGKPEIKMELDEHEGQVTPEGSSSSSISDVHKYRENWLPSVSSMQSLNNFVGNYSHKRTFSPHNARCRTRDNPYINPLLKEQFLYRSFKCQKCSRYFKSPGYLKAHYSKVH